MTEADQGVSLAATYDRVAARLVGRERELTLVLAAVAAGRDLILEGPPGTSKSTLLRAITAEWGIPLVFVEGNADLTPAKLRRGCRDWMCCSIPPASKTPTSPASWPALARGGCGA